MDEVNKDMREVIFDNLHATAYHGQALGNTILGPSTTSTAFLG
jgi:mitochondrial-processing peptidase subunit beta